MRALACYDATFRCIASENTFSWPSCLASLLAFRLLRKLRTHRTLPLTNWWSMRHPATHRANSLKCLRSIDGFLRIDSAAEAQATVRDVHYTLAICLFRLQRFVEAHQAIKEALETNPPIKDHMPRSCCFGRVLARCRKRMANKPG